MKNILPFIILGLACLGMFILGLFAGRQKDVRGKTVFRTDTLTVVRVDTVRIREPFPVREAVVRYDTVWLPGDTVFVRVPVNSYLFGGDGYRIEAEGYKVKLNSIEIYPRTVTKYITNETVSTITRKRRFGIGISAGYGLSGRGLSPYVGMACNITWCRSESPYPDYGRAGCRYRQPARPV